MEIKEIAIGGIDRHTPAQDAANGVCEELINVRPGLMGLEVYGEGTAISGDLDLENIHLHRWGGQVYYVGVTPSGYAVRFSLDGTTLQTLQWVSSPENVDIKSIGNMLVISDRGEDGKNPSTKTYVLEEADGVISYRPLDKDILLPGMSREDVLVKPFSALGAAYTSNIVTFESEPSRTPRTPLRKLFNFIQYVSPTVDWVTFKDQVKATLKGAINRVAAIDKHLGHGYVLLGTSVTLYDGTETAFGNLICVDLSPRTPYRDAGNLPSLWSILRGTTTYTNVLPQKDSLDGLFVQYVYDNGVSYWGLMPDSADLGGTAVTSSYFSTLTPKITLPDGYENLKDYIKSVNLWASRPYDKIDWDTYELRMANVTSDGTWEEEVPAAGTGINDLLHNDRRHLYPFAHIRRMSECKDGLHKQLLFKQKEWTVEEILEKGGSVDWECEFGSSEGTLGDNLTVDAWNSRRAGSMFVYNNRIHMFDTAVKIEVPDQDLQSLSGWDDEWYIGQSVSGSQSGEFWHMKYADDYMTRTEAGGMRDITLLEASQKRTRKGALGLYHDSSPSSSASADTYTWYYTWPRPSENSKYAFILYPKSTDNHIYYVYLSTNRTTLTHDTGRAKYMAISTDNSADDQASDLPWYNVPAESWEEATLRKYRDCTVIAYLKQEGQTLILRHENIPVLFRYSVSAGGAATMGSVANLSGFITYPDIRCERLVIQYAESGVTYTWETAMRKEGSPYNFAYAYVTEGSAEFTQGSANTDQTDSCYREKDTVVVSALNNPTVFPVEHSYRFVGEVTGMALALEELNSTQTGTYPVYVLTERGVFALNQGRDGVLYASITPINTDNCVKGKSVQVNRGVVYAANGRIYWLIGRNRTDILLPLDGKPDTAPRNNASYPLACQGTLYDATGLLSNGRIEDYLEGAVLGYDSFHDELLVSNPSYGYTYVFGFLTKRWFKTEGAFGSMDDHHLVTRAAGGTVSAESPARGAFTVGLLAVEAGARISYNWVATHTGALPTTPTLNAGDYLTLRLGDTAVASMTLQAPATIAAALSLLTKNLSWIETDTGLDDGVLKEKVYIYSGDTLTGKSLVLTDETQNTAFTMPISASSGIKVTEDKLIGSVFTLAMENPQASTTTISTATVAFDTTIGSLCRWIASSINSSSVPFTASVEGNRVSFVSNSAGSAYNGWLLKLTLTDPSSRSIPQSAYVYTQTSETTGGTDTATISPASGSIRILDMTSERRDGDVKIHIQTRPMKLTPMAFGVIQRMIARVRAKLTASQNLSVYAFTSDNLENYLCSSAEQRSNCTIDRIRLERTPHGRKYTVLVIGGIVPHDTELSTILFQVKPNAPKKIR